MAELGGVWKRYFRRGPWVLREIDLRIEDGAILLLVGGNGEGKSTLLRIVAGASQPTRGTAVRPQHSVAYLPERLPADTRMTARTYLAHLARLRGREHEAVRDRSLALLEQFGLTPGADVPIGQLSKGNRQKVGLAQALGAQARLTVLDEPFAGLDEPAAAQVRTVLLAARAQGRSLLVSTHRPGVVETGDPVYRLSGSRLVESSAAEREKAQAPTGRLTRLVLRPARSTGAPSGRRSLDLDDVDGVRSVVPDPDGQVVVLTDDPDRLLAVARSQDWSFVEGGPHLGERP